MPPPSSASLALLLGPHDVDDLYVGVQHPLFREAAQVRYGLVHVVGDYALALGHVQVVDGHQRRLDRRRGGSGHLHGAGAACAVADDAGDVANHVVDAVADLLELASQQPGDGGPRAHGGCAGSAQGRQLVLVGLDVDPSFRSQFQN